MPYPSKTTAESILQTAIVLLEQHGTEAFSTRALALACGIKAPSLYRYFPDRQSLEQGMANVVAEQLDTILKEAQNLEPRAALEKAAESYLSYAQQHPALYNLLMQPQASRGTPKALWNTFLQIIGAITKNPDDTANAVAFWAFLHGYATLERNGAFGKSGAQNAFGIGLETWLRGLKQ